MVKKYFLTRRNLRDLVIALSAGSAIPFDTGNAEKCIAFGMLGLGCFIHCISKGTLIRNVVLCTKGIYQVVRHPYYLANYLIDWSFCLLSGNLFLLLLYPFLFFLAYGPTIRSEEQLLFVKHSGAFIKSTIKIPQVFPDIHSLRNISMIFDGFSPRRITRKECFRITKFFAVSIFLASIHYIGEDITSALCQNGFSSIQGFKELLSFLSVSFLIVFYITRGIFLSTSNKDANIHQGTHPS
ncbi:MAG TPA: isoprenylcysteine carboxylmethyltransferase family protein [Syntrophorhabdaceae bacterium]|nr:isoprenylcysteine carboxylmethyltransferase family protein [Syntrophorhabdaceae bacterium]HQM81335.1 isoprenylcysteine carboxylmethyltransferase family protein [Syntrophorhabdaceae bacterium]